MNKTVLIALVVAVFCVTFSTAKPEKHVVSLKSLGVTESKACDPALCYYDCQSKGWDGGICITADDSCECWNDPPYAIPVAEEKHQVVLLKSRGGEENARACSPVECNKVCKSNGFKGGLCSGGVCKCWK